MTLLKSLPQIVKYCLVDSVARERETERAGRTRVDKSESNPSHNPRDFGQFQWSYGSAGGNARCPL